ncbi:hypothetical protein KRM28CT15_35980 [Krasilnikovia sp. M28-CT-15]
MYRLPDTVRLLMPVFAGVVLVVALVGLSFADDIGRWLKPPLFSYHDGSRVDVYAADGCLDALTRKRRRDTVRHYCAWARPPEAGAWVPVTEQFYRLDDDRSHAVEVVAFGLLPDDARRVRYTLPGGQVVEATAEHHDALHHPAFWIHLTGLRLPVDLRATGGRAAFASLRVLDAAGQEIPVV